MDYWDQKLMRDQLDEQLDPLRGLVRISSPRHGWIKMIRKALGMTTTELGERTDLDQSRISRIESAEPTGDIKVSTLEKIAEGLDMKFVYGFVSKQSLQEKVREQARKIAEQRLKRVNHSMKLEKQALDQYEYNQALDELIDRIMIEQPKNFWRQLD